MINRYRELYILLKKECFKCIPSKFKKAKTTLLRTPFLVGHLYKHFVVYSLGFEFTMSEDVCNYIL